jgi:hypothetical protein
MSRRVAAFLAAIVATAAVAAIGAGAPTSAALHLRPDVSTIVDSVAHRDPPLAVIRAADDSNLSAFGRIERIADQTVSIDGFVGTLLQEPRVPHSQPLTRVAELAIRARSTTIGPSPGRAPPATRHAALLARTS